MDVKDYYKILGVSENASAQEIKSAYRGLAKQYHPDKNQGDKKAEEIFKSISEAHDVLGDPKKKTKYDEMRRYGFDNSRFNGNPSDFGSYRTTGQSNGPGGFTFEGFEFLGDLSSILNQFFGRTSPFQKTHTEQQQGQDIHIEVEVPFEKAIQGGKVSFSLKKADTCPSCKGGGGRPGSTVRVCSECHGRGTVNKKSTVLGGSARPCPSCYGKGQVIENPCQRCQGKGIASVKKTYSIQVTPGTEDGEQIRLKSQGHKDPSGLPPGHMYVTVRVKPHHFFEQRHQDIHCPVQISDSQASRGTVIQIKTVHGDKVRLKIPPNTQDGAIFRIPGMGVGKNKRGDQMVTVKIAKTKKKAV